MKLRKILIVDDDKYILRSFSQVLTKRGFEVETAETGKQALQKLKQGSFDVALIDVAFLTWKGQTCLKTLKRNWKKQLK